jgi:hypothetical protein
MRHVAITCFAITLFVSPAFAVNENTTVVLHARDGFAPCNGPQQGGLDCRTVLPVVNIEGMSEPWVFMYLRNYDATCGVQCAYTWPPSWTFLFGVWNCQGHQLVAVQPAAPGALTGTIATVFDQITGGGLAPVGRLVFADATSGCLDIIESGYPFGNHTVQCTGEPTPLSPDNVGRVCVGPGGYGACEPALPTPVEPATWGSIKSTYR